MGRAINVQDLPSVRVNCCKGILTQSSLMQEFRLNFYLLTGTPKTRAAHHHLRSMVRLPGQKRVNLFTVHRRPTGLRNASISRSNVLLIANPFQN